MWPPCLWLRLATPVLHIRDPSGCYSVLIAFWAPPRSPWPCTYRWLSGCFIILVLLYSIDIIYFSLMLPLKFISFSKLYVFHCVTHNSTQTNDNKIDSKPLRDGLHIVGGAYHANSRLEKQTCPLLSSGDHRSSPPSTTFQWTFPVSLVWKLAPDFHIG